MKILTAVILTTIFCYSCKTTELVYISVLQPAPVTVPAYIKNVAVVNRSVIAAQTKPIDAVDKVFSLEGANLDKEGAQASITGLVDALMKNNRFTNVSALNNTAPGTPVPGMFPSPLSWDTVEKICRQNKADALFALEIFDTDSKISYAAIPVTLKTPLGNVPGIEHQANMLTMVKTGWRIYDPAGKNILDEYPIARDITFSGKGINPVAAAGALIGRKDAVKEVGGKIGERYAFRIIPYWIRVSRDYYVKGTDNLKIARRKAQTGNWNGAAELWKKETTNPNNSIAGRACYNMAIICEINGDLDLAITWSQKAYENYNNQLALRYVNILKKRKTNNEMLRLQQQAE